MEKLNCKSLMIGDWVIAHRIECVGDGGQFQEWKQIGYITRINEDTVYVMFDEQKEDWEEIDVKDIHPIPLTPEILEKNGFVIKKKWAQIGNFGDSPLIMWHFEDNATLHDFKHELEIHQNDTGKVHITIPCEYVHELQHALRLCGITKNIIL